jgi:hypothetical protein
MEIVKIYHGLNSVKFKMTQNITLRMYLLTDEFVVLNVSWGVSNAFFQVIPGCVRQHLQVDS